MENEHIRVDIMPWGTVDITDKKTGTCYKNQLQLVDDSEIGDGWYHANAREDKTVYSFPGKCRIEKVESGCVRCVFRITKEMEIPVGLTIDTYSQYRSNDYITVKIVFEIGLSENARFADVNMSYENLAKNHRVRLMVPTYTEGDTYFADQAFYCCCRKVGMDDFTQNWREYDPCEKAMSGIVGKRDADGNGLAFVSWEGLHECACTDDEKSMLYVTLLRGFQKTVLTNGETGGQILGTHSFRFALVPVDKTVAFSDLVQMKNRMEAPILTTYAQIAEEEHISDPEVGIRLSGENICLSVLKCAEREKNAYIARVYNASDMDSTAILDFGKTITSAEMTNLYEERTGETLKTEGSNISFSVKAWQIRTVIVTL